MSSALEVVNGINALLNLAADWNISEQKLIDLRAARNGEPFTEADLSILSKDAQSAIDSIKGDA